MRKEKIFKRKSKTPFSINFEELKKPFNSPTSVAKVFCTGCGAIYEIDLERARQIDFFPERENYQDIYFISDHCNITCHDGENKIIYTKKHL